MVSFERIGIGLEKLVLFGRIGLVWKNWFGRIGFIGRIGLVWKNWFGLEELVWFGKIRLVWNN